MTKGPSLINKQVGKYLIINEISRGGMGIVYLGQHVTLNRYAAVKMLFPHLAAEASFVKRFREEMNAMSKVKHPNIVDILDYEEAHGTYFIIMEVVVGRPLEFLLKEFGPMAIHPAAAILRQVLAAIGFAHDKNILHRDIKPSNIIIDENGNVKVLDFGIAKIIGGENLTQTGFMVGSPHYISPEQAQGEPVVRASDLYSIGVVLFQMLTGRPPFVAESPVAVVMAHIREEPPKPSSLNPNIPPQMEKLILKCLDKKPERRYQNAREMTDALEAVVAASPGGVKSDQKLAKQAFIQTDPTMFIDSNDKTMVDIARQDPIEAAAEKQRKENRRSIVETVRQKLTAISWQHAAITVLCAGIIGFGTWLGLTESGRGIITSSTAFFSAKPTPTSIPSTASALTIPSIIPRDLPDRFGVILGIDFELVPSGRFVMGAQKPTGALDDTPVHDVQLDRYMISRYEITNRQYEMFIRETGYPSPEHWNGRLCPAGLEDLPVTRVSWIDADLYCKWMTQKTGLTFRLPTEAEWERAAGSGGSYPWGDKWSGSNGNTEEAGRKSPVSGGAFASDKSTSGIFDMGGNVREWVNDFYSMSAYASMQPRNPTGPNPTDKRVVRGGAFNLPYKEARVTRRDSAASSHREDNLGFRIVLTYQNFSES